eukprot:SAG31_NODE_326_length_17664_cov_10.038543_1_plen_184_part_10
MRAISVSYALISVFCALWSDRSEAEARAKVEEAEQCIWTAPGGAMHMEQSAVKGGKGKGKGGKGGGGRGKRGGGRGKGGGVGLDGSRSKKKASPKGFSKKASLVAAPAPAPATMAPAPAPAPSPTLQSDAAQEPQAAIPEHAGSDESLDLTQLPTIMDKRFDALGDDVGVRPTIVKAGEDWQLR